MSERRYTDREVTEILRMVTEASAAPSKNSEGLTLAEIQSVVNELGIDPSTVADAARKVDAGIPETHIKGSQVEFVRTFDGVIDDAAWEEILLIFRRRAGVAGEVSVRGITREWNSSLGGLEEYHATVTTKDGRTKIRLTHETGGHVFLAWMLAILPVLLGPVIILARTAKSGGDMTLAYIASALMVFLILAGATAYNRKVKKHSRSLDTIFKEIEPLIQDAKPVATLTATTEDLRLNLEQGSVRIQE